MAVRIIIKKFIKFPNQYKVNLSALKEQQKTEDERLVGANLLEEAYNRIQKSHIK